MASLAANMVEHASEIELYIILAILDIVERWSQDILIMDFTLPNEAGSVFSIK